MAEQVILESDPPTPTEMLRQIVAEHHGRISTSRLAREFARRASDKWRSKTTWKAAEAEAARFMRRKNAQGLRDMLPSATTIDGERQYVQRELALPEDRNTHLLLLAKDGLQKQLAFRRERNDAVETDPNAHFVTWEEAIERIQNGDDEDEADDDNA